jgi:hypothetical protein
MNQHKYYKIYKHMKKQYLQKKNTIQYGGYDGFKKLNWEISYTSGAGEHISNIYDILVNYLCVITGIRSSFMLQPNDYGPDVVKIMTQILTNLGINPEDAKKTGSGSGSGSLGVSFYRIDQGIVIYKTDDTNIIKKLDIYSKSSGQIKEDMLGNILQYPCAGDAQRVFITNSKKVTFILKVKNGKDIFAHICSTSNSSGIDESIKYYFKILRFIYLIQKNLTEVDKNVIDNIILEPLVIMDGKKYNLTDNSKDNIVIPRVTSILTTNLMEQIDKELLANITTNFKFILYFLFAE